MHNTSFIDVPDTLEFQALDRTPAPLPPLETLTISVVIAWVNPLDLLVPVLEAFAGQSRSPDEIIIVTRHAPGVQAALLALFPQLLLVVASPQTPITRLRALGIQMARGSVVAVTEDHCVPSSNWVERIAAKLSMETYAVIGGVVENACTGRLRDWAAFLTEYAGAVRPARDDAPAQSLPGNNVAYRRELVDGLVATLTQDRWESFYLSELDANCVRLVFDPDLIVLHRRPFDFYYFLRQRFYFSRSFAGMRNQSLDVTHRAFYALGCAVLPPLLWLRGLRLLVNKGRLVGRYLGCTPLIAVYYVAGACGECIGYLFGGADSLERVE